MIILLTLAVVVLGGSTTQLFRNLSHSLSFPEGSEVILSKLDHEANLASWISLAERQSLVIKWWAPSASTEDPQNSNPKLTPENLDPLISDKTVFVACTHASNILGTIHDVKTLARTLHGKVPHALFCVDAVAFAPHRLVDVKDLDVDFYAFSWYKVRLRLSPLSHSPVIVTVRSVSSSSRKLTFSGLWASHLATLCSSSNPRGDQAAGSLL